MATSLTTFRCYARVDPGVVDDVLELCLDAAKESLDHQGVAVRDTPQYDLLVYMLALHFYDNRGVIGDKTAELPQGVMAQINQLADSELYRAAHAEAVLSNAV